MAATEEQVSQIATALASCDTVDGYSLIGVADETTVDVNGDPIAAGAETIDFFDAAGEYLYSCEKEGPDGWAELGVAGEETVDINGDPIAPGTEVIDFYDADGVYVASCEKAVADGYATQGIADETTVDADGNPILAGSPVINFYDGDGNYLDSCLKEGPDGYAAQGVASESTVDVNGDSIPAGTNVIDFFDADGAYVSSCAKAGPDGYSAQAVSSATTVDANGDPIAPDQDVIDFYDANGVYVNSCLKSGPDGFSEQDVSDGSDVDLQGNAIDAGVSVIRFYNENGDYVNSCVKSEPAKDCEGVALTANSRVYTTANMTDRGLGFYHEFVPSGPSKFESCNPADRTKTDHAAFTFNEEGQLYKSPAGSASWTRSEVEETLPINTKLQSGVVDLLPLNEGTAFVPKAELEITVQNPSNCRVAVFQAVARYGGITMETGVIPNSWQVRYRIDKNGAFDTATNNWWANHHDTEDTPIQPGELYKEPAVILPICSVLQPCAECTIKISVESRGLILTPDSKNQLNIDDGVSMQICGILSVR